MTTSDSNAANVTGYCSNQSRALDENEADDFTTQIGAGKLEADMSAPQRN